MVYQRVILYFSIYYLGFNGVNAGPRNSGVSGMAKLELPLRRFNPYAAAPKSIAVNARPAVTHKASVTHADKPPVTHGTPNAERQRHWRERHREGALVAQRARMKRLRESGHADGV